MDALVGVFGHVLTEAFVMKMDLVLVGMDLVGLIVPNVFFY
jgi:hypothetical protein